MTLKSQNWTVRHARAVPLLCLISVAGFSLLGTFAPTLVLGVALLLFLAGVPHGATERLDGPNAAFGTTGRAMRPTLGYTAIYIVFGILVMASWLISPVGTLLCFLGLSAWHFGRSEPASHGATWQRLAGLWVIVGSFLIYPDVTLNIFRVLCGLAAPDVIASGAALSAEPVVILGLPLQNWAQVTAILVGLSLAWVSWRQPRSALRTTRTISLIAVFICLPPIPAVATYFFVLHSLGETARTVDVLQDSPWHWLRVYAPASLPALIGGVGLLSLTAAGIVPIPYAAGLALAFVVPHMLPLERLTQAAKGSAPG